MKNSLCFFSKNKIINKQREKINGTTDQVDATFAYKGFVSRTLIQIREGYS